MTQEEQWYDAYNIAEKLCKEGRSVKRGDLDIYSQIVCARYDSIFSYNPHTDEYSFRNQALAYGEPVAPKCRRIADVDLEEMRKSTMRSKLDEPTYMKLTPIFVVPPSTLLVFNHSLQRPYGLTNALERISKLALTKPTERDIQPGAEFIYKHRDQKCYRVLILGEVGETNIPDVERKYEVAFLDICQMVTLKLKNLYMPLAELSLDYYACALQCARIIGIKALRSGFVHSYDEDIRKLYTEKFVRKSGIQALVYKTDEEESKIIVDFPSFVGEKCTESQALLAVHGHQSTADRDPIPLTYQRLMNNEYHPLKYARDHNDSDDTDIIPLSTVSNQADCPFRESSVQSFLQQRVEKESMRANVFTTTASHSQMESQNLDNDTLDESIASFRSARVTPKPTFDEPVRGDSTPTNAVNKPVFSAQNGWFSDSPDGWGTPGHKGLQVPPSPKKSDRGGKKEEKVAQKPVSLMSIRLSERTIQRPLVAPKQKPFLPPDRNITVTPKLITPTTTTTIQRPLSMLKNRNDNNESPGSSSSATRVIPSIEHDPPIIESEQTPKKTIQPELSPLGADDLESPKNQTILERRDDRVSLYHTPMKEVPLLQFEGQSRSRKNGSSVGGSAVKSIKAAEIEDDVFEAEEEVEAPKEARNPSVVRRLSAAVDQNSSYNTTRRNSTSSSTARLMMAAQANFHDDGDDDEGWGESEEESKKVVVEEKQEEEENVKKMTDALIDALEAHKEIKTEQLKKRIREHFKSSSTTRTASVSVPEEVGSAVVDALDDASNKSNCPTVSDGSELAPMEELTDEFANIPDGLTQLAESLMSSVQESAFNKDRRSFVSDIYLMEMLALKSPGDTAQRFWKRKVEEARSIEPAFD